MSQDNAIKMECEKCKFLAYRTHKNKKTLKTRLNIKKHCQKCGSHQMFKETK